MKRRFHWSLPAGFLLALTGMLTFPVFAQFPATRDFAWLNLALLASGVALIIVSLVRAVREPQQFRGKIVGSIVTILGVLALGFFCFGIFYLGRVPKSEKVQKVGEKAPEFSLPDQKGNIVSLQSLLAPAAGSQGGKNGALIIFYRGYW